MKWSVIKRKLGKVDRAVEKAIEKAEIPGAVVLARMRKDGELVEHLCVRGFAVVRPERIPMTRETIFDLASLTKVLATTTAVMLLVDEGALALDDPVAKVLPHFSERDKEAVTLRHLLTHSSGLKPWRAFHDALREREKKKGEPWVGAPQAAEWVVESICRSAPVHPPGTAAVYGDLDFIVLGAVVEAVTGESLADVFRARIAEPLGLKDTFFVPLGDGPAPEPLRRRMAATENCSWRQRILWGEVHDPNAFAMGGVAGHAGLFGTADDVMRYATALLDVWHGRSDVLPAERLREFATRQNLPAGSDWALGWDTPTAGGSSAGVKFSPRSIGHLGFTGTSLWIDLDTEAVVVMLTNRVHLVAKKSKFTLRPVIHDLVREAFAA
jgi:CubicO group peptidase (beta-lactamase class C family)